MKRGPINIKLDISQELSLLYKNDFETELLYFHFEFRVLPQKKYESHVQKMDPPIFAMRAMSHQFF